MSVSLKGLDHGSRKKLKKWLPLLEKVNQLGSKMTFLSDKELRDYADKLKRRATEEPLNNLVIESFALVREASKRATGLYPYDVQVISKDPDYELFDTFLSYFDSGREGAPFVKDNLHHSNFTIYT